MAESASLILLHEFFYLAKGAKDTKDGNTIIGGNYHSEAKARENFLGILKNSGMSYYRKPLSFHLN